MQLWKKNTGRTQSLWTKQGKLRKILWRDEEERGVSVSWKKIAWEPERGVKPWGKQPNPVLPDLFAHFFSCFTRILFLPSGVLWAHFWKISTLLSHPPKSTHSSPVDPNQGAPQNPSPEPLLKWSIPEIPFQVLPVLLCTGNSWEEHTKSKGCPSFATSLFSWKIHLKIHFVDRHYEGTWKMRGNFQLEAERKTDLTDPALLYKEIFIS